MKYLFLFLTYIYLATTVNTAVANSFSKTFQDSSKQTQKIAEDEFEEFEEFNENEANEDEFEEFESFEENNDTSQIDCSNKCAETCNEKQEESGLSDRLKWVLGILFFTILSGFLVRNTKTRNLRGFFLIASIVILGFYRGACPCPISSVQNLFLALMGVPINWETLVWFLALIPITYIFGRVWCGWICHLGALQELIYLPTKIKVLQSEKAQKIMRIMRIFFLILLIIQLFITKDIAYIKIDPFKVAFNLFSTNTTGWVLLALTLITSVFIYRPFCKTVCPIGLILGWVSKIPKASVIGINDNCSACKICNNTCKINAITRDEKVSVLENQECIACGECLTDCRKDALNFFRKNKEHNDKFQCKSKI